MKNLINIKTLISNIPILLTLITIIIMAIQFYLNRRDQQITRMFYLV